ASGKNKGKMARVLAAKAALGLRIDALSEWNVDEDGNEPTDEEKAAVGIESRYQLEKKLAALEGKPLKTRGVNIAPDGQPAKFELKEGRKYNVDADAPAAEEPSSPKKDKKSKKDKDVEMKDASEEESSEESESESSEEEDPNSVEAMAKKAGLSVARYQRKLERGEITIDEKGNPVVVSKKDLKKAKKEAKKEKKDDGEDKKRKRDDEGEDKAEKKKKKSKKSKE
ncbi:Nucleolar protein 58, partial [Ascosphaera atra]